jgi:hypothetical protein
MAASEVVSLQGLEDGSTASLDGPSHLNALGQVDINQMKPNAQSEKCKGIVSMKSDLLAGSEGGVRHKAIIRVFVELADEILEPIRSSMGP